jgi:hypothetical protein
MAEREEAKGTIEHVIAWKKNPGIWFMTWFVSSRVTVNQLSKLAFLYGEMENVAGMDVKQGAHLEQNCALSQSARRLAEIIKAIIRKRNCARTETFYQNEL